MTIQARFAEVRAEWLAITQRAPLDLDRFSFIESVDKAQLQQLGYKVPLEGIWPVGARLTAAGDWWRDPEAWVASIVDRLAATWPAVAPRVDEVFVAKDAPPMIGLAE